MVGLMGLCAFYYLILLGKRDFSEMKKKTVYLHKVIQDTGPFSKNNGGVTLWK